ncbi:hypothetical protein VSU19_22495 [Verrucomicrobiales bacterium BCK34]|nr:hypothetical protein [Verrucomicrobiales bacterium BCK34]
MLIRFPKLNLRLHLMSTEPFIQPRFTGKRFEEHTLPVSAARDLAAYEELVIELARHLYRVNHRDRERVPKGFAEDFQLHIERIEEGSTQPLLSVLLAGALVSCVPPEITQAKDLINRVIATEETEDFPSEFPKELYRYFNRIGRSLETDESIEWTPKMAGNRTVLNAAKRKRLVLADQETYEAEIDIVGQVEELNARKKTGILRTAEFGAVDFEFEDVFLPDLRGALGTEITFAHVEGIGVFDVNDRLKRITEIELLETIPHYHLISAIDGLSSLEKGWLEGNGVAFSNQSLSWLTDEVSNHFPPDLKYPSVVPTEEGNVSFEWILPLARIELEINFADHQAELYATNLKDNSFIEETYQTGKWELAFSKVKELLKA